MKFEYFGGRGTAGGKKIAVIGSGIAGASAAWALHPDNDVTLFEADARPGGHTATVDVDYDGRQIAVDTGFIVFNELNYPNFTALLAHLDVSTRPSSMGFSLSLDGGRLEWCGETRRSIFAQKRNYFSPTFLWMLREILRFNQQAVADRNSGRIGHATIGEHLVKRGFSAAFRDNYLIHRWRLRSGRRRAARCSTTRPPRSSASSRTIVCWKPSGRYGGP